MKQVLLLALLVFTVIAAIGCGSGETVSNKPVQTDSSGVKGSSQPATIEAKE